MKQKNLFDLGTVGDIADPYFDPPLARASDPRTSHLGAIDAHKRLGDLQRMALEAARLWPDRTQMELARLTGTADRTIGRRLNELVKAWLVSVGPARRSGVTGRPAGTYRCTGRDEP